VDMNLVMTGDGRFVEVQGTAETNPFSGQQLTRLTALATSAIAALTECQRAVLSASAA